MTYHHRLTNTRGDCFSLFFSPPRVRTLDVASRYCAPACTFCCRGAIVGVLCPGARAQRRHKNAANIVTFLLYPLAYPITIRDPRVWNEIIRKDCAFVSHAGVERTTTTPRAPARMCRRGEVFLLYFRARARARALVHKAVISV